MLPYLDDAIYELRLRLRPAPYLKSKHLNFLYSNFKALSLKSHHKRNELSKSF